GRGGRGGPGTVWEAERAGGPSRGLPRASAWVVKDSWQKAGGNRAPSRGCPTPVNPPPGSLVRERDRPRPMTTPDGHHDGARPGRRSVATEAEPEYVRVARRRVRPPGAGAGG